MKNRLLIILGTTIFLACGKTEEKQSEYIKSVVYEIIEPEENIIKRTYSGSIKSEALSNLSFRVGGTINTKIADLGDVVSEGDVLATLDNTEYVLNYNTSIANYSKATALLKENEANFNRSRTLYLENSISKASYDNATAQYKSAVANNNAALDAVNLSKLKLDYTKLVAPVNGVIGQVESEINQVVNPGETIFVLSNDGERSVEFNVSQAVVGNIKKGQKVSILVEALNNKEISGTISNIGPLSIGFGSTYPIKAKIDEEGNSDVKVGMIVNVIVYIKAKEKDVISVPISAVLTDSNNEKYVYVIKEVKDNIGVAKKQIVTLSEDLSSDGLIVKTGLEKGDFVIIKGSSQVIENQKVSLIKGAE